MYFSRTHLMARRISTELLLVAEFRFCLNTHNVLLIQLNPYIFHYAGLPFYYYHGFLLPNTVSHTGFHSLADTWRSARPSSPGCKIIFKEQGGLLWLAQVSLNGTNALSLVSDFSYLSLLPRKGINVEVFIKHLFQMVYNYYNISLALCQELFHFL